MKRLIEKDLLNWKNMKEHKPMLIFGARQIGKTYTMITFGKEHYKNYIYCNFEQGDDELKNIFEYDLNPKRIIESLEIKYSISILAHDTLIIFDEIQGCEKALTSLKYFNEQAPEYDIIAAGSLFGVALKRENYSFPVGKVSMLTMYPFNFEEFLLALNENQLVENIKESYKTASFMPLHEKALSLYRTYLVVGGYPAAIKAYINNSNFDYVRSEQSAISTAYVVDIIKYSTHSNTLKAFEIYNSIFAQFAKETTKFQYSVVNSKARSKTYEDALDWLIRSNVVLRCTLVIEGKYPITAYEDKDTFKIYHCDSGIFSLKGNIDAKKIIRNIDISNEVNGVMAENYVATTLKFNHIDLHYWARNTSEVDFVVHINGNAIPIEVKSSNNGRARSLRTYIEKYNPKYSIKISSKNFGFENNILSIPLYATFCIGRYPSIIKDED